MSNPSSVPRAVYAVGQRAQRSAPAAAASAHERQAKLQWVEQQRLLNQRAELLSRSAFPKLAPGDKGLREVLQPFLDEVAALERERDAETSALWSESQRAKEATAQFHELVTHLGSGPDFLSQLQEAMEGAERRLRSLRQTHEQRALELGDQALGLMQELEAVLRTLDAPLPDEPGAHPAKARVAAASQGASPTADGGAAVAVDGEEAAAGAADGGTADAGAADGAREQIVEIEAELAQLGGVDCGWEAGEHAAFMRLRAKHLGAPPEVEAMLLEATAGGESSIKMAAFRSRVREAGGRIGAALHKELGEVAEHEARVQQRALALARKRELLSGWRERRRAAAESARVVSSACDAEADEAARAADAARDARRRQDDAERAARLAEWREGKRAAKEAAEEARRADAARAARRAAADAAERDRQRQQLAEHALQRAAEAKALHALHERQQREATAEAQRLRQLELLAMRERDATLATRRRRVLEDAREARCVKEERLRQMVAKARPALRTERDPDRLLRPTAASARPASAREPAPRAAPKSASAIVAARDGASAFGSSSQRFGAPATGQPRPASASAVRHGSRTPSWRAGLR